MKETEIKIEVQSACGKSFCDSDFDLKVLNKKQSEEQTKDQHVRELESALEEVRSTFFFSQIWFLFVLVWRKR